MSGSVDTIWEDKMPRAQATARMSKAKKSEAWAARAEEHLFSLYLLVLFEVQGHKDWAAAMVLIQANAAAPSQNLRF